MTAGGADRPGMVAGDRAICMRADGALPTRKPTASADALRAASRRGCPRAGSTLAELSLRRRLEHLSLDVGQLRSHELALSVRGQLDRPRRRQVALAHLIGDIGVLGERRV